MSGGSGFGEDGCGQRGHALGSAGCGEQQRADDEAPGELDLVGVVPRTAAPRRGRPPRRGRNGAVGRRRPRAAPRRRGRATASRRRHRGRGAPGGSPVRDLEPGRGGDQREGEGGALAELEVAGMPQKPEAAAGRRRATMSSPGASAVSRAGCRPEGSGAPRAPPTARRTGRRSRRWRRARPAGRRSPRVRRDAGVAPAEDRMAAVLAVARVAAGAGLPPVAGAGGVEEIGAAGALHQVAADGRGIADLWRGAGEQRLDDRRKRAGEGACAGEVRVSRQRADPAPPSGSSSIRSSPGSRVRSTSRAGRAAPVFIRSRRLVPAARQAAPGAAPAAMPRPRGGADVVEEVHAVVLSAAASAAAPHAPPR